MAKRKSNSPVYRLPDIKYGSKVFLASELTDVVDWGLLTHNITGSWVSKGEGIKIGVADTGKPEHDDLADAIVAARNFTNSSTVVDKQGHSTHVCGTIAARENGKGVVGVAPKSQIVIAKVLGDDGTGTTDGIAAGINYLVSEGCDIISMSLGGGASSRLNAAVTDAVNRGVFVICAAGNENVPGKEHIDTMGWPAKYNNVVAVGSYNKAGQLSSFSSRGNELDIAFPGEDILSTWPGNTYRRLSGTSMATPFCSGLVAELLGQQRMYDRTDKKLARRIRSNKDLLAHLQYSAIDKGPVGKDTGWGWGVVDTKKFFDILDKTTPPAAPVPRPSDVDLGVLKVRYPVTVDGKTGWFVYIP